MLETSVSSEKTGMTMRRRLQECSVSLLKYFGGVTNEDVFSDVRFKSSNIYFISLGYEQ